jgi:hypothetical protein
VVICRRSSGNTGTPPSTRYHQPWPHNPGVHLPGGGPQRQIPYLVDHEDGGFEVGLELLGEAARGLGLLEVADQVLQGGEVDRVAGLAGGDGQADGEHGLADSGWAEEADVGLLLDEAEGGQVADLAGVQLRLEGEVEAVQALVVRQPRQLERVAEPAALAHADLFFQHQVEEVQVAHGLLFDVHPCPRPVQPSLLAQGAWSRVDDLAGRSLCSDELAALNQRPSRQERPGGQS